MHRGLAFNLLSNAVFFASSYVLHFFLGNTMPAAAYGIVGTIITVLDFEYMFLSNGTRQSVAREISLAQYDDRDLIVKTFLFQMVLVAIFFSINFFGSGVLSRLLNDDSLGLYFRVAAFLVPANGFYVMLLGISDGLRKFGTTALLGSVYPIAKLSAIPFMLFVFPSDPVIGVEIGFLFALILTSAIGIILLLAYRDRHPIPRRSERIRFRTVIHRTLSFSFFFIIVSLVLSIDTLIVKTVSPSAASAGYYTGAVNFGKLSYSLMSAFATIILPVVSYHLGRKDIEGALARIRENIELATLFILPMSVIISATSASLLTSFYSSGFVAAAPALMFLSISHFFMGVLVLLNLVLASFKGNRFSDILSVASLVIVIPLFIISARHGGMTGIALTSMLCTGTGMAVSLVHVRRKAGNVITRRTVLLVGLNVALWVLLKTVFTKFPIHGLLPLLGIYVLVYVVFLALLVLCRVIALPSPAHLRRVLGGDNGGDNR